MPHARQPPGLPAERGRPRVADHRVPTQEIRPSGPPPSHGRGTWQGHRSSQVRRATSSSTTRRRYTTRLRMTDMVRTIRAASPLAGPGPSYAVRIPRGRSRAFHFLQAPSRRDPRWLRFTLPVIGAMERSSTARAPSCVGFPLRSGTPGMALRQRRRRGQWPRHGSCRLQSASGKDAYARAIAHPRSRPARKTRCSI